jgi:hypothetical protein
LLDQARLLSEAFSTGVPYYNPRPTGKIKVSLKYSQPEIIM